MTLDSTYSIQTIDIPAPVGSRITLLEDVDIDVEEGSSGDILFEGYVERYVPETGLIEFEDSDVGQAELERLIDEADAVEVISNYEKV